MSAPIAIPTSTRRDTSPSASSSSSSSEGLYIPVHRRSPSLSSSASSTASSWRPHSRNTTSFSTELVETLKTSSQNRVYTPSALLLLARSPLASLPPHARDALRATAPEIVMNRRQRKAFSLNTPAAAPAPAPASPAPFPANAPGPRLSHTPRRRSIGGTSAPRRGAAHTKVADEVSWRGRPRHTISAAAPMAMSIAA